MKNTAKVLTGLEEVALENPILALYYEQLNELIGENVDRLSSYPPEVLVYLGKQLSREGAYQMLANALTWEDDIE